MKKYILGIAVALIFLAYSHVLRNQHSVPVVAPALLSHNNPTKPVSATTPTSTTPGPGYKDGTYTGSVENAFYGNVQVSAIIQDGKLTTVNFEEYPNDNPNSININQQAMPYLKQEAIQAQSAKVSIVTGATLTSQAFVRSLTNALSQASQT